MTATKRPWLLGHGPWCAALAARCPLPGVVMHDSVASESRPFFWLVNAANAVAFGGLGMPLWVQLDCATVPSVMVGLGVARADVDAALWSQLLAQIERTVGAAARDAVDAWQGLVPLSEFCAAHTPDPGTVVGFSLFTLERGLGLRTKAMGLAVLDARRQIGITQLDSRALRTHLALGPLVVDAIDVPHEKAGTIVYALDVPGRGDLAALARGERSRVHRVINEAGAERVPIAAAVDRVRALRARGTVRIVDVEGAGAGTTLVLEAG